MNMKLKIKPLILAFLGFYILYAPLRDLLKTRDFGIFLAAFESPEALAFLLSNLICFFSFSIGAYWVFFRFYREKKKYFPFLLLPFVALIGIFLRYFLQEFMGKVLFGVSNYPLDTSMAYYIVDNLYYAIIYISLGTVIFFVQYAQFQESKRQELTLQNQKTELAFLRSQLNPHFLFNTLNNIYSLVYYKSENALRSVEKLSGLLRYALYEKAEKVILEKEIGHLNGFIDLEKMRLSYEPQIEFQQSKEVDNLKIVPFILIPFVENGFKHGNLKNAEKPLKINIQKTETDFEFIVENEKLKREKDEVGGIGVENVRRRLDLIYGEKADLKISETKTQFKIHLKIALTEC